MWGQAQGRALLLAAAEIFPELDRTVLLERDREFVRLGKQLTEDLGSIVLQSVEGDFEKERKLPSSDLIIAFYSLGKVKEDLKALEQLWAVTGQFLVVNRTGHYLRVSSN